MHLATLQLDCISTHFMPYLDLDFVIKWQLMRPVDQPMDDVIPDLFQIFRYVALPSQNVLEVVSGYMFV